MNPDSDIDGPSPRALESTRTASPAERRSRSSDAPDAAALLAALKELVRLKDLKETFGETADYRSDKDRAWDEARRLLRLPGN